MYDDDVDVMAHGGKDTLYINMDQFCYPRFIIVLNQMSNIQLLRKINYTLFKKFRKSDRMR